MGGGERIEQITQVEKFLLSLQWRYDLLNRKFSCQIMDILIKFAIPSLSQTIFFNVLFEKHSKAPPPPSCDLINEFISEKIF